MANTTCRVAVLFGFLVLVQVSCAVSQLVNVPAVMTVNGFEQGEGGGAPASCYSHYLSDHYPIVSLSTEWYAGGERCSKLIGITGPNGKYFSAIVVDECQDCDNEVGASPSVWRNLELDTSAGEVNITWSDLS